MVKICTQKAYFIFIKIAYFISDSGLSSHIMMDTIIAKAKGFLLNPVETFQQVKDDEPKIAFTYFAVLLFIYSLFTGFVKQIALDSTFFNVFPAESGIFIVFITTFIVTCIAALIFAAWLHLWVYILGGKNGIMQTMKAILYGSTAHLLLGWIPVIGMLFSLWALMASILGVRELQNLSTGKAVTAFVIAVAIPLILIVVLGPFFFVTFMSVTGVDIAPENLFL